MSAPGYFTVVGLRDRQHYKNRGNMPWAKVHKDRLFSPALSRLTQAQRYQLIALEVLALSAPGNVLEFDPLWLKQALRVPGRERVYLDLFLERGLIEMVDGGRTTTGRDTDDHRTTTGRQQDDDRTTTSAVQQEQGFAARLASTVLDETETETETKTTEPAPPARGALTGTARAKPSKPFWPAEGAEMFKTILSLNLTPPRVGRDLKALVKANGWPLVKAALEAYLRSKRDEPKFASPGAFVREFDLEWKKEGERRLLDADPVLKAQAVAKQRGREAESVFRRFCSFDSLDPNEVKPGFRAFREDYVSTGDGHGAFERALRGIGRELPKATTKVTSPDFDALLDAIGREM